jgi:molybdopterin synthase sulfur carrier subunit
MKIVYFAWMREHIGTTDEEHDLPSNVTTVGALAEYLKTLSPGHAKALANLGVVRVAVNKVYANLDTPVSNADEVAFFPPVTGG